MQKASESTKHSAATARSAASSKARMGLVAVLALISVEDDSCSRFDFLDKDKNRSESRIPTAVVANAPPSTRARGTKAGEPGKHSEEGKAKGKMRNEECEMRNLSVSRIRR